MLDVQDLLSRACPATRLLSMRPLTGGVSAHVSALDVLEEAGERTLVLRRYGPANLARDPDAAHTEARLLAQLHATGLPIPEPLYHEPGLLLTTFMPGVNGTDTTVNASHLARFLARLHALPTSGLSLPTLPDPPAAPAQPDETLSELRIRAALLRYPVPLAPAPALLHGDLWPGNTLWDGGQLSGVLDWEDAALGDPLSDLGNTRLELLFFAGWDAMHEFTRTYLHHSGHDATALPVWDLRAALRPCGRMHTWGLNPQSEARMRERHLQFVQNACSKLER